jgi:hypothetical protein
MATKKMGGSALMFIFALVLSLGAVGMGVRLMMVANDTAMLAAGAVGLIATLAAWAMSRQISRAGKQATEAWDQFNTLFTDRMEQFSVMLNVVTEQQLLSDRGKSVAYRDKDREALRRAIREEMARGQYDAALVLINDMETAFGYRQDAEQLRGELEQQREILIRRLVGDTTAAVDRACSSEKWDEAMEIANRMASAYPNVEAMTVLPGQVQQRKAGVKQQLLARWHDAVTKKDIDGSADILQQLDMYVTPEEVAQLKDGALEIFRARIERLRERFKQFIHDKKWSDAMTVGEDIINEFPTGKLAQEVRDMMEMLKTRSHEDAAAPAVAGA